MIIALSGVQRLITESRRTTDLASGSDIVTTMANHAVQCLSRRNGVKVIFPADKVGAGQSVGVPNKIVALVPDGSGAAAAADTKRAVESLWQQWVNDTFEAPRPPDLGWPSIQWACAPASLGDYSTQWKEAQDALRGRKSVHDFTQTRVAGVEPCELSPRWSAVPAAQNPTKANSREVEPLSTTNWVKRVWHHEHDSGAFPPTNAIASAHYRGRVLEAANDPEVRTVVERLYRAACGVWGQPTLDPVVPGLPQPPDDVALRWLGRGAGLWVYPESWERNSVGNRLAKAKLAEPDGLADAVANGRAAASELVRLMAARGIEAPSAYLAVLNQDLDSMGEFLSGQGARRPDDEGVSERFHSEVSTRLQQVALHTKQRLQTARIKGKVVYAGGDDLLALVPAATALDAALIARTTVNGSLPDASTAVHFFHHASPLQEALQQAQTDLNHAAKGLPRKNGLSVGYRTASGSSGRCCRTWGPGGSADVDDFDLFRNGHLSPRLVWDLENARDQLSDPLLPTPVREAELFRLVERHLSARSPTTDTPNPTASVRSVLEALKRLRPLDQPLAVEAVKVCAFLSRIPREATK